MSDHVLNAMAQHLEPRVYDRVVELLVAGVHPQTVADRVEPQISMICRQYYHRSFTNESLSDVIVRAALEEYEPSQIASEIVALVATHHGWNPSWLEA